MAVKSYKTLAYAARVRGRQIGLVGGPGGWLYATTRSGKKTGKAVCQGWEKFGEKLLRKGRIQVDSETGRYILNT